MREALKEMIFWDLCQQDEEQNEFSTKELLDKFNIRNRDFFEKYSKILFNDDVYYKMKERNESFVAAYGEDEDLPISYFKITNKIISKYFKDMENLEEYIDFLEAGEFTNNFIPFYRGVWQEWYLFEKNKGEIWLLTNWDGILDWYPIADSFDEFIDGFYMKASKKTER